MKVESMIFQLPIPVAINKMAPSNIQKVDVSPTEPGINPQNMEDMSYVVGGAPRIEPVVEHGVREMLRDAGQRDAAVESSSPSHDEVHAFDRQFLYRWKWLERMRPLSTMKLSTRYRLSYSVIPVLPRKAVRYIYSAAF